MDFFDYLDDWILEDIFQKLASHDRLVCKRVCKRWYNLLMERKVFQKDRNIKFNTRDSKVYDAMIVLVQAKKPYDVYSIFDYADVPKNGLQEFFDLVGPFIEEFEYSGYGKCGDIFSSMPSLKYLTLDMSLDEAGNIFSTIKNHKPNFTYRHLEKLHIGDSYLCGSKLGLLFVIYAKKLIPQNCSVTLPRMCVNTYEKLERFCQIMKEVTKIKEISIEATDLFLQSDMEKFLTVENISCDEFTLKCTSEHRPYRFLEALQNKHPNLKEMKLECFALPPASIDLPKLVGLKLEFSVSFPSLKSLELLRNLKELELFIDQNECEFFHEPLQMPNLYLFTLNMKTLCHDCLEAFAQSFVNLKNFTLDSMSLTISWSQLSILIENWKNLRELNIEVKEIENQEDDFKFEPNENLQTMRIQDFHHLRIKTIEKIVQSFRNLEEIFFYSEGNWLIEAPILMNFIHTILPALTKLSSLEFWFDSSNDTEEYVSDVYDYFCDYLNSIGLPLQNKESTKESFVYYNYVQLKINRKEMTSKLTKG